MILESFLLLLAEFQFGVFLHVLDFCFDFSLLDRLILLFLILSFLLDLLLQGFSISILVIQSYDGEYNHKDTTNQNKCNKSDAQELRYI